MKRIWLFAVIAAASIGAVAPAAADYGVTRFLVTAGKALTAHEAVVMPAQGTVEVAFSPNGGATEAAVRFINEARRSVFIMAYGFTSNEIGRAVADARHRGIDVRVVVDRDHNGRRGTNNSIAGFLAASDIPVRIDYAVKIQHNKVIIVDGESVMNGSFNLTAAAEHDNAENITIHRNFPALARVFTENFERLWAQSSPLPPSY